MRALGKFYGYLLGYGLGCGIDLADGAAGLVVRRRFRRG